MPNPAQETTSKPAKAREQEAALTLFALLEKSGIGEKKASVAFLNKDALGLWFIPLGEFRCLECR